MEASASGSCRLRKVRCRAPLWASHMNGDQIITPLPDEDAPPRPNRLRVWPPMAVVPVVFAGVVGGVIGAAVGFQMAGPSWKGQIPTFVGAVLGATLATAGAVRLRLGLIGRGVRV